LKLVLDLFSGTGSATQSFVECGKHRVARIDIAGHPDIRADIRKLPEFVKRARPQFLWASPPCTEFSSLTALAAAKGLRGPRDPEKGMELVRATFDLIERLDPEHYCVENVRTSRRYISREYGEPQARIGAWMLWTNVPIGLMPTANPPRKYDKLPVPRQFSIPSEGRGAVVVNYALAGGSVRRSKIPPAIGSLFHQAICE
jgi:hypothetical protein